MAKGKRGARPEEAEILPRPSDSVKTERIHVNPALTSTSAEPPAQLKRFSFPITEDGKPAWDSMRLSSKDEFIQILKSCLTDKETVGKLGLGTDAPNIEIFSAEWTGSIYDAIGAVESYLAQRIYNIPPKIARECFTFTELEKEKLAKPTAALINKWALRYDWLVKFKEEIAVAILLVALSSVKLKMAQIMAAAQTAAKPNGAEVVAATAEAVQ